MPDGKALPWKLEQYYVSFQCEHFNAEDTRKQALYIFVYLGSRQAGVYFDNGGHVEYYYKNIWFYTEGFLQVNVSKCNKELQNGAEIEKAKDRCNRTWN